MPQVCCRGKPADDCAVRFAKYRPLPRATDNCDGKYDVDVTEGSRCRAQMNCIWAGRVVLQVKADTPGVGTETLTLATSCAQAEARHVLAGQIIELRGVSPGPQPPGQEIPLSDYRAELVVSSC